MLSYLNRATFGLPLIRRALQVIGERPRLLLFPAVIGLGALALALASLAAFALFPSGQSISSASHWSTVASRFHEAFSRDQVGLRSLWTYGFLAAVYFASALFATFANVAFYHEIMKALAGDRVSLRRGLAFSCTRLRAIFMWSLLSATVGLFLQLLRDRAGWAGRAGEMLGGLGWSVASLFVIPVIVKQDTADPFELLRGSATTLKKAWSEAVIGYAGLAGGAMLLVICWLAVIGLAILLAAFAGPIGGLLIVLAMALGLVGVVAIFGLSAVATTVHRCALYIYAVEGVVPEPFSQSDMDSAWRVK